MVMLSPPPTKPITLPSQCGFRGGGKREECAKPRTKMRRVSYGKIVLATVAVGSPIRNAVGSLEKKLIRLWNRIFPEP